MAQYESLPPPKNVPIPYGGDDICENKGVLKFFEDPDFVHLRLDGRPDHFEIVWATPLSAVAVLETLKDFIVTSELSEGELLVRHASRRFQKSDMLRIGGCASMLCGDLKSVIEEIYDSEDRVVRYGLWNEDVRLCWGPSWPADFHDIRTDEVNLRLRTGSFGAMARLMVDQCLAQTSMPGLRGAIDMTLDEFAVYEPNLAR